MRFVFKNHFLLILLVVVSTFRPPIAAPRDEITIITHLAAIVILGLFVFFKVNKWVGTFILYGLLSAYYPIFFGSTKSPSVSAFQSIMLLPMWLVGAFYFCKNTKAVLDCVAVICLVNVFWTMLQWNGIDLIWAPKSGFGNPKVGLLTNPNELSSLIAITIPAFWRKRWVWLLPFPIIGLLLADSTLGVVASLAAFGFFVAITRPWWWKWAAGVAVAGFGLFLIFVDTPQVGPRVWIIQDALKAWWNGSTIWGSGPGTWKLYAFKYLGGAQGLPWPMQTHCEYVQGLYELGLPFVVCLVGLCWNLMKRFSKKHLLVYCALVAVAVESGGHFLFQISSTAAIALVWVGIALGGKESVTDKGALEWGKRKLRIFREVLCLPKTS